jgi:hypothetical protein
MPSPTRKRQALMTVAVAAFFVVVGIAMLLFALLVLPR